MQFAGARLPQRRVEKAAGEQLHTGVRRGMADERRTNHIASFA